jgi:hypothetical protein
LGFICGYPVKSSGGEIYGGSMFSRSAASDTLQGMAIQDVNTKWGEDVLNRKGRETIGGAVCKKKYNPFLFELLESNNRLVSTRSNKNSRCTQTESVQVKVKVERMFGCACHHYQRKKKILKYGLRPGWQSFGVWSLKKAKVYAKREEILLNQQITDTGKYSTLHKVEEDNETIDDNYSTESSVILPVGSKRLFEFEGTNNSSKFVQNSCLNVDFTWKARSAYDDIEKELNTSPEAIGTDGLNESGKRQRQHETITLKNDSKRETSKRTNVVIPQIVTKSKRSNQIVKSLQETIRTERMTDVVGDRVVYTAARGQKSVRCFQRKLLVSSGKENEKKKTILVKICFGFENISVDQSNDSFDRPMDKSDNLFEVSPLAPESAIGDHVIGLCPAHHTTTATVPKEVQILCTLRAE